MDYLLSIGTKGGFYPKTIRDVLQQDFELKDVQVEAIRRADPEFNRWLEKQELGQFRPGHYKSEDVRQMDGGEEIDADHNPDSPVIIINGMLRDGWHRVAGKFANGEKTVKAYVS